MVFSLDCPAFRHADPLANLGVVVLQSLLGVRIGRKVAHHFQQEMGHFVHERGLVRRVEQADARTGHGPAGIVAEGDLALWAAVGRLRQIAFGVEGFADVEPVAGLR